MHPSKPHAESVTGSLEPYYSNEDVRRLHEIVSRAQELLPGLPEHDRLPTQVLFRAYAQLFKEKKLKTDNDNRYARVLFKIGGLRGRGTLLDKFATVMTSMDINIQYVERQGSSASTYTDNLLSSAEDDTAMSATSNPQASQLRPRSKSIDSATTGLSRAAWQPLHHIQTMSPLSRAHSTLPGLFQAGPVYPSIKQSIDALDMSQNPLHHRRAESFHSPSLDLDTRVLRESLNGSADLSTTDVLTPVDLEVDPQLLEPVDIHATGSIRASEAAGTQDEPTEHPIVRWARETNLDQATNFRQTRLLLNHLRRWQTETELLHDDMLHLSQLAVRADQKALARQAFGLWQQKLETARFYSYLENRVTQARDLQSLSKAYTYWNQAALEAVERTIHARAHVLRTRYFNAWRDISIVNELKVRRLILRKFFARWKNREQAVYDREVNTVVLFQTNLAHRVFTRWFWSIREAKTENAYLEKLKLCYFRKLASRRQQSAFNWSIATDARPKTQLRNSLRTWSSKLHQNVKLEETSVATQTSDLLLKFFKQWHREAHIRPATRQIQDSMSKRLIRRAFTAWQIRAQSECHAAEIDRSKILSEVIMEWRAKLRCNQIQRRMDERIKHESISNWQLVEREFLFKRNSDLNLKHASFQAMIHHWQISQSQAVQDAYIARKFATHKLLIAALEAWRLQCRARRDADELAVQMNNAHCTKLVLGQWQSTLNRFKHQEREAEMAEFYLTSRRTLKKWSDVTKGSKKDRLREAYRTVRRKHKMNLATNILKTWREKDQMVAQQAQKLQSIRLARTQDVVADVFMQWRSQSTMNREHGIEAISWNHQVILERLLRKWRTRSAAVLQLNNEATYQAQAHRLTTHLRTWAGLTLKFNAQEHIALGLRDRHGRKNVTRILMYWKQQTASLQKPLHYPSDEEVEQESGSRTVREEDASEDTVDLDIEDWHRAPVPSASNPLPGYLRTPSRRKAMFMSRFSTTPQVPLSTPFELELRKQYDFGKGPSVVRFGQSPLSQKSGFRDIADRK